MRPDHRRNVKFTLWGAVPCQQHNWLWLALRVSSHLGRTLVVLDVNRNDCIKRHAHPANLLHHRAKYARSRAGAQDGFQVVEEWRAMHGGGVDGNEQAWKLQLQEQLHRKSGMQPSRGLPQSHSFCSAGDILPLNSICSPATAATAVVAIVATHAAAATAGAAEASTIGMVVGHWQVGCLHAGWSSWRRTAASMPVQQRLPAQMSVYPIGFPTVTDSTRAALQLDPAAGASHATTDPSSPHQWNRIPCQHILGLRYSSSHRRRRCRLSSRRHRHPGPPEKQQQPQTPLPHPTQPAQQQPLPVGIPPLISQ